MTPRGVTRRNGGEEVTWTPTNAQDWDTLTIEHVGSTTTLGEVRAIVHSVTPVHHISFRGASADEKTAVCFCYSKEDAVSIVSRLDNTKYKGTRWAVGYSSERGTVRKIHLLNLPVATPLDGADDDCGAEPARTLSVEPEVRPRRLSAASSATRSSSQGSARSEISVKQEHIAKDAIWGNIALKTVVAVNLPSSASSLELHIFFSRFGTVCSFSIDRIDGMARIGYEAIADSEAAVRHNGCLFQEHKLVIKRLSDHLQSLERERNKEDYRRAAFMGTPSLEQAKAEVHGKSRKKRRAAAYRAAEPNGRPVSRRARNGHGSAASVDGSRGGAKRRSRAPLETVEF